MYKIIMFACMLALAAASPAPKPGLIAPVAYTAAYTAPVAYSAAYTAPVAYSAYSAPLAYSPYAYSAYSPYSYLYR